MKIGTVIGNVWATKKEDALQGKKLLVVALQKDGKQQSKQNQAERLVAVDVIGAGIDDLVLLSFGSAARYAIHQVESPIDAAVVGIIDTLETEEKGKAKE